MKKKSILLFSLIVGSLFCSVSQAQESSKYGSDSVTCVMNNSLYYEFFKQWKQSNYKNDAWVDAVDPWRWVFINCPRSTINIYLHGEKILDELIKTETDKGKRDKLIDTLMMLYDKRIKYFDKEGFVLGKKGVDLYKLRPSAYEEAYNVLKKSVDLEGKKSQGPTLIYYFRAAEKMVNSEKAEKTILVDIYDQTTEIIDYNIKKYQAENNQKKVTNWENIKGNIELSFEPYATCEDLISIYTIKFNETPNDVDLLKKITKILDKKKCTDSDLFFHATENLHNAQPTAQSAELMGKMYIMKEQYNKAADYLIQSIELYEDDNDKADAHYLLANVYFQLKKYVAARNQCYNAIKLRPNDGKPYILIGDMYVATAKSCGDNALTSKVAYWPAVDKYIKAKNIDPSVADIARSKINTYSQYFPVKETIFFYDFNEGDTYFVECWINENTKVRTSD
ncbi:MAG: hypothetical protein H8D45_17420 [Bacteroidetes bacterium]|nr:hypothetical protein [Bacteroidota bacterium]MBL7105494.1 hypothetical protein [Bacteroidales bacterium]